VSDCPSAALSLDLTMFLYVLFTIETACAAHENKFLVDFSKFISRGDFSFGSFLCIDDKEKNN